MFGSLPRRHVASNSQKQAKVQEETRPEPGSDSTYGIRSLGSVIDSDNDWDEGVGGGSVYQTMSDQAKAVQNEEEEAGAGADIQEAKGDMPLASDPGSASVEWTPTNHRSELPTQQPTHGSPPFALSGPSGYRPISTNTSPVSQNGTGTDNRHLDFDADLPDDLSEPSSPASFASLPSYMSSLSRTSSLLDHDHEDEDEQGGMGIGTGIGIGGSEELVMPTMSIGTGTRQQSRVRSTPASASAPGSGYRSASGPGSRARNANANTPNLRLGSEHAHAHSDTRISGGLKIVVLGSRAYIDNFISSLRPRAEEKDRRITPSDLGSRNYKILGVGDEVLATLMTGLSADEVESRIEAAYTTLNMALHPDPSPEVEGHLSDLVAGYAAKSDWVHLVIVLDDGGMIDSLGDVVPLFSRSETIDTSASTLEPAPPSDELDSPQQSVHDLPDPTPMPGPEGLSYFPSPNPTPQLHATISHQLINALDHPDQIQQASTTKFLAWRSANRHLSSSSHSHESSIASYEAEAAAMPTVARAQGGGEWEANLSRRLAKRRQSGVSGTGAGTSDQARGVQGGTKRGGGKRRSTVTPKVPRERATGTGKEGCGPLFPFPPSPSGGSGLGLGLGLGEMVEKTFGGLRQRWRWGIVAAAAVALVVGWNCNWTWGGNVAGAMRSGTSL